MEFTSKEVLGDIQTTVVTIQGVSPDMPLSNVPWAGPLLGEPGVQILPRVCCALLQPLFLHL